MVAEATPTEFDDEFAAFVLQVVESDAFEDIVEFVKELLSTGSVAPRFGYEATVGDKAISWARIVEIVVLLAEILKAFL